MRASAVAQLLDAVTPPPAADGHAVVRRIVERSNVLLGWQDPEVAILLLPVQQTPCPQIVLEHLEVIPSATIDLRLQGGDVVTTQEGAAIRCRVDSLGIRLAFENVVAVLCSRLEDEGTLDLGRQIPGLERLFMALSDQATTSVVGLWAELVVIATAIDPKRALAAWRADPADVFDFRETGKALEVKASRDVLRRHWFGLRQWRAAATVDCDVASFVVVPAVNGTSVSDLMEQIGERVDQDPALMSKLIETVGRTLGRDLARVTVDRFDLPAALSSLRFIPLTEVPHGTFDADVLDARWRCGVDQLDWNAAPMWSELGSVGPSSGGDDRTTAPRRRKRSRP